MRKKICGLCQSAFVWVFIISAINVLADVKAKNPAILILPNVFQEASAICADSRRGAALPGKKLLDFIVEEKGFVLEVGAFSPKLDLEFLKRFNMVVIGTGGEHNQRALADNFSGAQGRLLLDYVRAGGGLLVMRNPGWQFGVDIDEYNQWLAEAGIKILNEQITDAENQTVTVSDAKVFWTDNITEHPVTRGVKGFFYPNVYSLGYACYTDFSSPVKTDENWQILISGRESASSYERKKAGVLQPEKPGSYDKSPPILATREFGKGRIAVMPLASSPYWQDGYHVFWDRGFMMDGSRQNMKGDGMVLMKNLITWLATPSTGILGGYAPPQKQVKEAESGFKRIDWDRIQYRNILLNKNFVGLIGAMSNLSIGQDSPEAMIAAARKAGYNFIAFTEELGQMTEEKFNRLRKICAESSDNNFKAFQGLKHLDDSGNSWVVFSDTLNWPQKAWFGKDPGRLSVNNPLARGWGWPPLILLHPNKNPEKPWEQGNFKPISVYTYENGQLIDDAVEQYLQLLNNSFHAFPVSVHLVKNANEVSAARNNGFQTMVRWFDDNFVEAFKGTSTPRISPVRPVYVSEGPVIEDFRIINFGMTDLAIPGNDRCRLFMKASSADGLAEVKIMDAVDPAPWRRFLPGGKNELMTSIDFYHDKQRNLVMFVTDAKGRRAMGSEAFNFVQENSFIRCSDNYNTMPRGKWWGMPEHLLNIRGFENYLAVRNFTWCGTPRFPWLGAEGSRPSVEYRPILASRFGSIVESRVERHNPADATGNLDKTDQPFTSSRNDYFNAVARYVFFSTRQNSTLARIIEGQIDILKDFQATTPVVYSELGRNECETFSGSADYQKIISEKFSEQKKSFSLTLPGKGYAALYQNVFRGSVGIVALDGEVNVSAHTNNIDVKAIQGRLGSGKREYRKGEELSYRYLSLKSVLDPAPDTSFVTDIVQKLGIEGDPAYNVSPRKGSVESTQYILRLKAENHAFDGIVSQAKLPLNLPVMVAGLNPNWDAGILYRGRNRLLIPEWVVNVYNERFVEMVPREYDNELYHIPVLADGTGFLQIDTELGDRDVFIGNLLVCEQPQLKLLVTDTRKGREAFTVHNPTDVDLTATVKPAEGFGLLGDFSKTVSVPKGSTVAVKIGSGIEANRLETNKKNWRLPENCSVVREDEDNRDCIKVVGAANIYSSNTFPVDPEKTYRLSGTFKSAGDTESKIYLGLYPMDKNKQFIAPNTVYCAPGTETELFAACSADDTVIKIKNGAKWRTRGVIAFEVDDSGNFADLPNRNISTSSIEKVEQKGDHWQITLAKPCSKEYAVSTKVREQFAGDTFIYCGAVNQIVPKEWKTYSGTVGGVRKGALSNTQFRPGTAFVRVGILPNYQGKQANVLKIKDITLEEVKP